MNNKPTFIISDAAGQHQIQLLSGKLEEAQAAAARHAVKRGEPVLLYSLVHVATYCPPAVSVKPA